MAQRRRRAVGLCVGLFLVVVAGGSEMLLLPLANADDPPPLDIRFVAPPPSIQGKWWVPRYKGPSYGQIAIFSVGNGPSDSLYEWSGGTHAVYLNDQGQTAHGTTAHFHSTITDTIVAHCTHPEVLPTYGPGSCYSCPICVFDADITPPEPVGDANEETVPTFIGEGCRKLLTLAITPSGDDLPTPPNPPVYQANDPHWVLTLSVENDPPGIAFYDVTTGQQLTDLTWGWKFTEGHYDQETQQYVPGHWDALHDGEDPPSTVLVGVVPGVAPSWGAPFFVNLSLSVQDGPPQGGAGASDRVMVVPVAITKTPNKSVGQDERNLWYLGSSKVIRTDLSSLGITRSR